MHHSIRPPLSDVMTNQPQQGNTRLFGQMHSNNFSLIADSPVPQLDTHFLQNLQPSRAFIFNNQNNTFSASNVSDNLHGDYVPTTMVASHENFSNIMDQNTNSVNETVDASFHQSTVAWSRRKAPNLS